MFQYSTRSSNWLHLETRIVNSDHISSVRWLRDELLLEILDFPTAIVIEKPLADRLWAWFENQATIIDLVETES